MFQLKKSGWFSRFKKSIYGKYKRKACRNEKKAVERGRREDK